MNEVFINAAGIFLPGNPVSNEEMENYLGKNGSSSGRFREKILAQNGIKNRYYAIDKEQKSICSNAEMAAAAIRNALEKSHLRLGDVQLLATATTQGDLPVPGFASMVHAAVKAPPCEVASLQSVCAGSIMALQHAWNQVRTGSKVNAVCVGSEFPSRQFKASRYHAKEKSLTFDAEFLKWMLSDGAGALVLSNKIDPGTFNLKIDWIELLSHADSFPLCMYYGKQDNADGGFSWLDYPDVTDALKAGAMELKQDVRQLNEVIKAGVVHFFDLIDRGNIDPAKIDWLCCHYSSEHFKEPIKDLLRAGGASIPDEKWFSNLSEKGNTGAASIFIMLEELMYSGKLKEGDTILCMVPESGRCITSFMQLTVCGAPEERMTFTMREPESPKLEVEDKPLNNWLVRQLARVWVSFEKDLLKTQIVKDIHEGKLTMEMYQLLLKDLRQQVIDGSQWIARAASNIDIGLFDLRSAFIKHTATEHRDYQMLEANYMATGGDIEALRNGEKNIGSEALSAFMFQQASQPNPVHLTGAMFIIEGIGNRLAGHWGEMIKKQLKLEDNQVSFFTYHGVADEHHFHRLEEAINILPMDEELARKIVKTAKTVAHLYKMQLEELGNY